jgi:hypothetical protein
MACRGENFTFYILIRRQYEIKGQHLPYALEILMVMDIPELCSTVVKTSSVILKHPDSSIRLLFNLWSDGDD